MALARCLAGPRSCLGSTPPASRQRISSNTASTSHSALHSASGFVTGDLSQTADAIPQLPPLLPELWGLLPPKDASRAKHKRDVGTSTKKRHAEAALLELVSAETRLVVHASGRFEMNTITEDGTERLTARGGLVLPTSADQASCRVTYRDGSPSANVQAKSVMAMATWGREHEPIALLVVLTPPGAETDWCKGLDRGYVLEFSVRGGPSSQAEVTIELEPSGHWFGGGHLMRQLWPLNTASLEVGPYYAFDNGPNGLNTLVGPQWMTSRGLLVVTDPDTPFLHVGMNAPTADAEGRGWVQRNWGVGVQNMNREYLPHPAGRHTGRDGLLRLQARSSYQCHLMRHPLTDWLPHRPTTSDLPASGEGMVTVGVALCSAGNAREACQMALRTMRPPGRAPSAAVLENPIWTTWARYFTKVDQAKVMLYAREIVERGLQRSVMEIDDRWQTAYGDLEFDARKFPDPRGMVDRLHQLGFKVTVWVMPFVEEKSAAYREGAPKGYFIKGGPNLRSWWGGLKPGFLSWWHTCPVVALDLTNPEAVAWFVGRLRALQAATGLDGFKFDAGEPCFLPRGAVTHAPMASPVEYTRLWVEAVAGAFAGGCSEVRTGHGTQHVACLTRMGDRFSTWGLSNGLQSIIPTLLTSGLLGYPFCLPDMIGGNAYFGQRPDPELMVRWAQANALMPAMQFSIAPWDLSKEAEALCASALELRKKVVSTLKGLAEEAAAVLSPIARPMWWLDPADEATYAIWDQFALGNDIVVAPVLVQGAVSRDVYLPAGRWRDLTEPHLEFEGGQWLRDLPAPLSKLPCFERIVDGMEGPAAGPDAAF